VPPPKCFAANMLVISILFAVEGLGIYITANLLVIIILFVVAPFRVQRFWIGRMKTKKQRCEWRKAEPESESESESESEGESERGGGGGGEREGGGGGGEGGGETEIETRGNVGAETYRETVARMWRKN
jgi:uncharacterized membrane protein YgcG